VTLLGRRRALTVVGALVATGRAAQTRPRSGRGAKPGDLPVEQPAMSEFVVNAGAATALGLALAPAVRSRADKVIE